MLNGLKIGKGKERKKRCYNSGKISGLPYNVAYLKFEEAGYVIESMGYESVNPIKRGLKASAPYWAHIVFDLWLLVWCRAAYFQSDWKDSRGAKIENRVAVLLNKELYFEK